jgi:hypothetical protein
MGVSVAHIPARLLPKKFDFHLAGVREKARRTSCQSNLKQIGLGLIRYSQDCNRGLSFSGGLPPHVACNAKQRVLE